MENGSVDDVAYAPLAPPWLAWRLPLLSDDDDNDDTYRIVIGIGPPDSMR